MALACFITFSTYGTRLHGREDGSVDRDHNRFGDPFLTPDEIAGSHFKTRLRARPYVLDTRRREVVLGTILEVSRHRGWRVLACHVRTNHVHVVAVAEQPPERVMQDLKAYASRNLKDRLEEGTIEDRWTRHGSTRHLFDDEAVHEAVTYVLDEQGAPMERYDGRTT